MNKAPDIYGEDPDLSSFMTGLVRDCTAWLLDYFMPTKCKKALVGAVWSGSTLFAKNTHICILAQKVKPFVMANSIFVHSKHGGN